MIALCGNNPERASKYRHTWNIVKIGKTYYHPDATFDNSLGKCSRTGRRSATIISISTTRAIFRDHEPLIAPAPLPARTAIILLQRKKLSFTKNRRMFTSAPYRRPKRKTLTFHWRGGYLTKEVLRELLDPNRKSRKRTAENSSH